MRYQSRLGKHKSNDNPKNIHYLTNLCNIPQYSMLNAAVMKALNA